MFQLRSMLAAGQRQAQRMEQGLALAARCGPSAPRSRPQSRPRRRVPRGSSSAAAASSGARSRSAAAAGGTPPTIRAHPRAGRDCRGSPARTRHRCRPGPARADAAPPSRTAVAQDGGGEARQVVDGQLGRRPPVGLQREPGDDAVQIAGRRRRLGRAQRGEAEHDRQGLDALLAQRAQAEGTQPLGEVAAGRVGDQRQMRECGAGAASACRIASCRAVLLTWSSPRMTWLMPSSASSTAEANR